MRYGERKTVVRDARLRTTAAEHAMLDRLADMIRRHGITGPYWYILGRDNYTVCVYHVPGPIIMPYTTNTLSIPRVKEP